MRGPTPWQPIGLAAACRELISATAAAGAGAAAASSAAAAGSAAAATAASTSVLSTIGTVATIASTVAGIGMQLMASEQQANVQRGQAAAAKFAADQELIRGQQQSNQLREALLRTLSSQRSRYAAAGLVSDEGSGMTVQEQAALQAERELTVQTGNTTIRSEQQRTQASLLEDSADWTATAGTVRAGINLFDAADRYAQRQPGTTTSTRPRQ